MVAVSSSWLVASIAVPAITITVDATPVVIAADDYYLRHATSSLSLIDYVAAQIVAAVGGTCTITIKRNRTVRIVFNTARSVTWGTGTQLRNLLGFTADLASLATHDAPQISPLLWSPGWPAIPETIAGVLGYSVDHIRRYKSDDGQRSHAHYLGTEIWQDLEVDHVVSSRMRVTPSVGGTFHEFYEQAAKLGARLFHYELITEDSADTSTNVTWTTGLGPYVLREEFKGRWNERRVKGADVSNRLPKIPLHVVAEYT